MVHERHDRKFPDKIVDLNETTITENMHIHVPGFGILEPTDWALNQIGQSLGIKWKKWFGLYQENPVVTAKEAQEELSRRFNRIPNMGRMIRASHHETASAKSDGVLEAFLSPTYVPIDDVRIFERLAISFGTQMDEMMVLDSPIRSIGGRWGWGWGNDRTSHYTFITGEERDLGQDNETDNHLAGFHMRNSEFGAASLTLDDFWFRIICMNGLMAMVDNERLLYRQHRNIENSDIDDLIREGFGKLKGRHERVLGALIRGKNEHIADPQFDLEEVLRRGKQSGKLIEKAQLAWEEEEEFSRFGMVQAITRAARDITDPDHRYELELLAGRFLLVN